MAGPTTSTVTLASIVDAIEGVLDGATGLTASQTYDEITEGIQDMPMLQVYPESCSGTDIAGVNDRTTFKAGVRQTEYIIHADLYAAQRAHIGQNISTLVDMIDAITTQFETQSTGNLFGLSTIKSFHWRWERVVFEYATVEYTGARFYITIRVF